MAKRKPHYYTDGLKVFAEIEKLTENELKIVKNYIALGYELIELTEAKKETISVEEMSEELTANREMKKDFDFCAFDVKSKDMKDKNEKYNKVVEIAKKYGVRYQTKKGDDYAPYFIACQIYNKWKKENE